MFHCFDFITRVAGLTCLVVVDVPPEAPNFLGAVHCFVEELLYLGAYVTVSYPFP